jgi:glutathione S-transferase
VDPPDKNTHFKSVTEQSSQYIPSRCSRQIDGVHVLQVINDHLANHEWLAADMYSIADIASFCWIVCHAWAGRLLPTLRAALHAV